MRIACLQFAPRLGDHDNNINRADSILNRAKPRNLDLLVLPELTFTGSTFQSPDAIAPYLQHAGSGITSLWARTIGLKYGCVVVAGYPERAEIPSGRSKSLRYYNSALAVNAHGETLVNYRKTFLDTYDKPWASEGPDEFFQHGLQELGNVTIAIGMDINPYENKAPRMAWEFAYHVLHKQSNLVIILMAWLTPDDLSVCSSNEREPDMNVLSYWVSRLEPLIRAEDEGEIIVVIANRCGTENDAVYAGTSCVLGIQDGEVKVYGMLGRGERDLLVVDTSKPPLHNLVTRTNAQGLQRTVAYRVNDATDHNRPYTRGKTYLNTLKENRKTIGSIDSILAGKLDFQQNNGQISYASKQKMQSQVSFRNISSQHPIIYEEQQFKNAKNLPSKDAGPHRYGESDESSWKSTSLTNIINPRGSSAPNAPDGKSAIERSEFSGSEDVMYTNKDQPMSFEKSRYLPASSYRSKLPPIDIVFPIDSANLPDSAYSGGSVQPSKSAYPPNSAFSQDSAYSGYSAYPPESGNPVKSAYYRQSAVSMTSNAPQDQKPERVYYGDKELVKIMKDIPQRRENTRTGLDSAISEELLTDEELRSALSPESAFSPQSASSMTVNVPWKPMPAEIGYNEDRGMRNVKASEDRREAKIKNKFEYNRISLALTIPSALESTYSPNSALSGSAYSLNSGVSMIVNAPWEPQMERRFYGDQELEKVMGTSALHRIQNVLKESSRAKRPLESYSAGVAELGIPISYGWTHTATRGTDKSADSHSFIPEVISPEYQPPQPANIAPDIASQSRSLASAHGKLVAAHLFPKQREAVYFDSAAPQVEYHSTRDSAVKSNTGPIESTESRTFEPLEPETPAIEIADEEIGLSQQDSTATEKSPYSAHSITYEMPQMAINDLFPGEGIISPAVTAKTNSSGSGLTPFPAADNAESAADPFQSWTSNGSAENSPSHDTSSNGVEPSWDSAPMPSGSEERVDQPASSSVVNLAKRLPSSITSSHDPRLMVGSFYNPRVVPSTTLAQDVPSNHSSDSKITSVVADDYSYRFGLTSLRNLLRRAINTGR